MLRTISFAEATTPAPPSPPSAPPQPATGSGFAAQVAALRTLPKPARPATAAERSSPNANAKMVRSGMDARDASAKTTPAMPGGGTAAPSPAKGERMPSGPVSLPALAIPEQPMTAGPPLAALTTRGAPAKDGAEKPDHHRSPGAPGENGANDPGTLPVMPTLPDAIPVGRAVTAAHPDGHGRGDDDRQDENGNGRHGDTATSAAVATTGTNGSDTTIRHETKPDPANASGPDTVLPSVSPTAAAPVPVPTAPESTSGMRHVGETLPVSTPAAPATPTGAAVGEDTAMVETVRRDDGGARISLSLHPAEMGPVKVDLDRDADGRMNVVVTAHNAETLRGLIADQAHLHAVLDAGAGGAVDRQVSFRLEPDSGNLPGGGSFADGRGAPGPHGDGSRDGAGGSSDGGGSGHANPGGFGDNTGSTTPAQSVPTTGRMLRSALVNVIA